MASPARTLDDPTWDAAMLASLSSRFEGRPPEEVLHWGFDTFAPEIALATGFGPSGIVLMHLVSRLRPEATVFYLDTDLLFPETYRLRDRLAERLGITFTRIQAEMSLEEQAAAHGPKLWKHNPDQCCFVRKVLPLRRFLATKRAWVTGLRRDQSPTRARIGLVEWDEANGLVKLNPLANWTSRQVWTYLYVHDLPYNELHDAGYPSIGCLPCTRPVVPGEDERAGRWQGRGKTECGIHLQPQASGV